jgi:hypothetical protein
MVWEMEHMDITILTCLHVLHRVQRTYNHDRDFQFRTGA